MAFVTKPIAPLIQKKVRNASWWEENHKKLPPRSSGKPVSGMRLAHSCSARSLLADRGFPAASAGRQSIINAPAAAVPIQLRKHPHTVHSWMIVYRCWVPVSQA